MGRGSRHMAEYGRVYDPLVGRMMSADPGSILAIDILFDDVAAMALSIFFDEFSVAEAATDDARGLNIQLGALPIQNRKVFAIWGCNFRATAIIHALSVNSDHIRTFDRHRTCGSLRRGPDHHSPS
jgi:hypothetical protein